MAKGDGLSKHLPSLEEREILRTGQVMEKALPGMAEYLVEKFYSEECDAASGQPHVSVKEKTGIFRAFAANVSMRPRIEERLGIGRGAKSSASSGNPLIVALGGNVAVFKSLPPEKRQELLLAFAKGEVESPGQGVEPLRPGADEDQDGEDSTVAGPPTGGLGKTPGPPNSL